jgi:hypothetical protein
MTKAMGHLRVGAVKRADILRYMEGIAPGTNRRSHHKTLRKLWRWAHDLGHVENDPMAKLKSLDAWGFNNEVLSAELFQRFLWDWAPLTKAAQLVGPYRNHLVAHLILEYDQKTESYRLAQTPKPNKLYVTIESALPITTRSVATLAFLFGVGSGRIKDFERLAKEDAATFWGIKGLTRRD